MAKNTVFNLLGEGFSLAGAIIALPLIIRWLGEERSGLFMLTWSIRGYLQFLSLRLGFALTKFASEAIYRGEMDRLNRIAWATIYLLAILGSIGGLALGTFAFLGFTKVFQIPTTLWEEAKLSLFLIALAIPLTIITSGFQALLQGGQHFDLLNLVDGTGSCLRYLVLLFFAGMGFNLPLIMSALLLVDVLQFFVYSLLSFRIYPSLRVFTPHFRSIGPLIRFGGWLSISQLVGESIRYLDRFVISLLLPIGHLNYYLIPIEIIDRLWVISSVFNKAIFPVFSALDNVNQSLQFYVRAMKFMLIISFVVTFILVLFDTEILTLYLGVDIALKTASLLPLFALGFLIGVLGRLTHTFVLALGYPDAVAKFHLLELPLYAGSSFLLTKELGIWGTAWAWLGRTAVETGYVFFLLQRAMPQNILTLILKEIGYVLALSGLLGLLGAAVSLIGPLFAVKTSILFIGIVAYGGLIWHKALSQREREALTSFIFGKLKL